MDKIHQRKLTHRGRCARRLDAVLVAGLDGISVVKVLEQVPMDVRIPDYRLSWRHAQGDKEGLPQEPLATRPVSGAQR